MFGRLGTANGAQSVRALCWLITFVAVAGCNGPKVAEAERAWAEEATLQIARVNDVVALQVVTNLAGESTAKGGTAPKWAAMHAACVDLLALLPEMRQVASEAPPGYERAGENLNEVADHVDSFASQCETATSSKDLESWYSLEDEMSSAGDSVIDVARDLPGDITCPANVPNRPETCDV